MVKAIRMFLGLAALLATSAAAADRAALVDYLNGLDSFAADFVQTRYDEDGELLETAHGTCRIKRPGRFRWAYTDPYSQLIVSDGATLWIYDEDLEQVTTSTMAGANAGSPAALLGRETDVAAHYTITAFAMADDEREWFRLEPRDIQSDFSAIELAFGDGEIRGMRLTDNLGQVTVLGFSAVQHNEPIDDAAFAFVPPAGVDVVQGAMP